MAIDSVAKPNGVDYDSMTWQELTNGFTGMMLAECGPNEIPEKILNKIKHLNKLSSYGMFAPIEAILEFNAGYMMNIENMSQDWEDGKKMNEYHNRHLHSLKLNNHVKESKKKKNNDENDDNDDDTSGSGKKKTTKSVRGEKCSREWLASQNICFNYQNDQCDQGSGHDDGAGKAMIHCCGWCQFQNKGLQNHHNLTCTNKTNPFPFRRSRSNNGQLGGGQ